MNNSEHNLEDDIAEILIDEQILQNRISELATEIEAHYQDVDDLLQTVFFEAFLV